jgi:hypothetical protein
MELNKVATGQPWHKNDDIYPFSPLAALIEIDNYKTIALMSRVNIDFFQIFAVLRHFLRSKTNKRTNSAIFCRSSRNYPYFLDADVITIVQNCVENFVVAEDGLPLYQ